MDSTVYALGEKQSDEPTPWKRHAVLGARPGTWANAICEKRPRVWVHSVAGHLMDFPGPFDPEPGVTCPECMEHVTSVVLASQLDDPKRPSWVRRWLRKT